MVLTDISGAMPIVAAVEYVYSIAPMRERLSTIQYGYKK